MREIRTNLCREREQVLRLAEQSDTSALHALERDGPARRAPPKLSSLLIDERRDPQRECLRELLWPPRHCRRAMRSIRCRSSWECRRVSGALTGFLHDHASQGYPASPPNCASRFSIS